MPAKLNSSLVPAPDISATLPVAAVANYLLRQQNNDVFEKLLWEIPTFLAP